MTLCGMPQAHTILSPQLRLPSRTISMPRACSYVSRAREGLAERDGLCRHSIRKSKTFRAGHANFNQSVTMARLRPLTLGVQSSNVTWMEALCLLCQSEVADQMGDLSTMQATLRYLRSGSSKKRNLGALALLVMLAAGTPAPAADTIEELLREDEASSQNDALRVDLNALTEAEWEYYFQVGLKKVDTQLDGKLVEHESDWSLGVIYVWIAALAAGFGIAMGAIKAWPSMRRVLRILLVPVPMEDLGRTIAGYAGYEGTRL